MMSIVIVHESAHPEVMAWLNTLWGNMRTDPQGRFYWHDDMPGGFLSFCQCLFHQTRAVIAHVSSMPQALCFVQMSGKHPRTGESLCGQVSFFVRPGFRRLGKRLFVECLSWLIQDDITEVIAIVHPAHRNCRMLTRACGFRYDGLLPGYLSFGGRLQDMRRYIYVPERKVMCDASDA